MNFNEWNKGQKVDPPTSIEPIVPDIDHTTLAKLNSLNEAIEKSFGYSSVWTPEVQAVETFRRRCLCRPPYKQPGWRPKA